MNILRNRPMWLAALAAGAMLSSCTSEIEQGGLNGDAALADGTKEAPFGVQTCFGGCLLVFVQFYIYWFLLSVGLTDRPK